MMLIKISSLVVLICVVKFSASQVDTSNYIKVPWVDLVNTPSVTPYPISINSSQVMSVNNAFDRFVSITYDNSTMVNTGNALVIYCSPETGTFAIGGALGLQEYKLNYMYLLWNLSLGRSGSLLDGEGAPVELNIGFVNTNYTVEDAANHRDGWFILVHRIQVVDGPPNTEYTSFAKTMRRVSKAGTKTVVTTEDIKWLGGVTILHTNEYCFPGSNTNYRTGVTTYSALMCVRHDSDLPIINKQQFYNSFGSLRNKNNKPYNNAPAVRPITPGTIIGEFGVEIWSYVPTQ